MKYWLLVLLSVCFLAGCGSGGEDRFVDADPVPEPTATVALNFVLARTVPANVTTIEIRGLDGAGNTAFEPVSRAKATQIQVGGIPITVKTLRLRYFEGAFLVGEGDTAVNLNPNGINQFSNLDFTTITVTNLSVLPAGPVNLNPAATQQLAVTVTLSNGEQFAVTDQTAFVSSVPGFATVGATTGLVTAVATGTTVVMATYRGVSRNVTVNVL